MPDIDIDFCYERRQEVIDYVVEKYGKDQVAQIVTFGTLAAKGVVRDVGRVLDLPYAQCDAIAKMIPADLARRALSEGLLAQGTHRRPLPALCVPGSGIFRRAGRARSRKIKMVELERLNCKKWGNKNVTGKDHSVGRHWRNRRL